MKKKTKFRNTPKKLYVSNRKIHKLCFKCEECEINVMKRFSIALSQTKRKENAFLKRLLFCD